MTSKNERQSVSSPDLILASGSPRRRELLDGAGYKFKVIPPVVDEPKTLPVSNDPVGFAEALAYYKAASIAKLNPETLVIGADTVVAVNGKILGKPDNADHAREMLHELSHHPHKVITGIALIDKQANKRVIASAVTSIKMKPLSQSEIEEYIASGEWEGKAGAYGIQGKADKFVEAVEGSWSNVVGLPMELLTHYLHHFFGFPQ